MQCATAANQQRLINGRPCTSATQQHACNTISPKVVVQTQRQTPERTKSCDTRAATHSRPPRQKKRPGPPCMHGGNEYAFGQTIPTQLQPACAPTIGHHHYHPRHLPTDASAPKHCACRGACTARGAGACTLTALVQLPLPHDTPEPPSAQAGAEACNSTAPAQVHRRNVACSAAACSASASAPGRVDQLLVDGLDLQRQQHGRQASRHETRMSDCWAAL